jgi:hypothetical protein
MMVICKKCGLENDFEQPYPYNADFTKVGFLYNDEGNLTLIWSIYDPVYEATAGEAPPWDISPKKQKAFEKKLPPAPSGGRWMFKNSARCAKCGAPVSPPVTRTIYFLEFEGSINAAIIGCSLQKVIEGKT